MDRYICIHGHFYQPPRENPWLETIEQQNSAYPYHDWNERITDECYASNAHSRILNEKKQIIKIVNNYAKISFNFGPTLMSWLEEKFYNVYQAILTADQASQQRLEGHGNALAQPYNHTILPLSSKHDKYTQIIWGIRDFFLRFQRRPEGLWLPETAVDLESLEIMTEQGIKFTILAQHQARRFRKIGSHTWQDMHGSQVDSTMPYLLQLPQGRSIAVFFYDGLVASNVAFSKILNSGEIFATGLTNIFSDQKSRPQLANIATDGETYGHHRIHGDMALSYALDYIERNNLAKITNYAYFLAKNPPTHEVEIVENSSWSCIHGIGRWKSACGCNTGKQPDWNQNWRTPLKEAFDWLRDALAEVYEEKSKKFFADPWQARNNYIDVIIQRSEAVLKEFFAKNAHHPLTASEQQSALCLLEMQRNAMLMYTSCGWFFDDLSGIETMQVISYAARAIQLSENFFENSLENKFLEKLAKAHSNLKSFGDGRTLYRKIIKPCILDWPRIGAHYGISSLFKHYKQKSKIYCYEVTCEDLQHTTNGNNQLLIGYGHFKSNITAELTTLAFSSVHFGDQNIHCGVCKFTKILDYPKTAQEITSSFKRGNMIAVNKLLTTYFGESTFSIDSLFRDEQRRVLNNILTATLREVGISYTQLYQRHAAMMRFIANLHLPLPEAFRSTADYVINAEINVALTKEKIKLTHILKLLSDAELANVKINNITTSFTLKKTLEKIMQRITAEPHSLSHLNQLINAMRITQNLPFSVNLFHVQNHFYAILQNTYPEIRKSALAGDAEAKAWVKHFANLGDQLSVYVN